jgi:hypothetical protein
MVDVFQCPGNVLHSATSHPSRRESFAIRCSGHPGTTRRLLATPRSDQDLVRRFNGLQITEARETPLPVRLSQGQREVWDIDVWPVAK